MKINNTFSFSRIGLLIRQQLLQNAKTVIGLFVGVSGVLFLILYLLQLKVGQTPLLQPRSLSAFFFFSYSISIIISSATAFPAFRNKEKTINYLMLPASTLEKFTYEFFTRVVMVILVFPLLFWFVYSIQCGFLSMIYSDYNIVPLFETVISKATIEKETTLFAKHKSAIIALCLLPVSFVFLGASVFQKQPLIKTGIATALTFFFFFGLMYLFVFVFGFRNYNPPSRGVFLIGNDTKSLLDFIGLVSFVSSVILVFVSYLKVKEKEG